MREMRRQRCELRTNRHASRIARLGKGCGKVGLMSDASVSRHGTDPKPLTKLDPEGPPAASTLAGTMVRYVPETDELETLSGRHMEATDE